jgi:hypothetical protein
VDGAGMYPPEGESEPRPATRSNRILGLMAAVGFSLAMWVFIALAVIGLILKIVGPRDAGKSLSAAGNSVSQLFNFDNKATEPGPPTGLTGDLGVVTGPITTLDGKPLEPGTPPEGSSKPAPVIGPH